MRVANESRGVLQHQDGGRVQPNPPVDEGEGPSEIPPSYDSIPQDQS